MSLYNAVALDHPDYDISSNTPDKEYLNKGNVTRVSIVVRNYLMFIKCDKETADKVLIACTMLGFCQTIQQENGFPTNVSRMGNTKVTYKQRRKFARVFAISTNKIGEV